MRVQTVVDWVDLLDLLSKMLRSGGSVVSLVSGKTRGPKLGYITRVQGPILKNRKTRGGRGEGSIFFEPLQ